jgi:hypothetical protein
VRGRGKVTWETLSVVSLILSGIWHVGRDIHQTGDREIRSGFSNHGSAITMSNKNAWSILLSKDAFRGHIFFKGCLRLLGDADAVAISDQQ